jgi:trimethylamine--corrinoid protein Co-methyltransferase
MGNYTTAFFHSTISDNTPVESWNEAGKTDSATRANTRWKTALADYEAPVIDVATDDALQDFVNRKKSSMTDQWY